MIEHSGSMGPRIWWAQWQRHRSEHWAREVILARRNGPGDDSPASQIADHVDMEGKALDPETAAVELINVLRPIAAVARFISFAALALHEHPRWKAHFAAGHDCDIEPFTQEVRRFYSFFPFTGGRAKEDLSGTAFASRPAHGRSSTSTAPTAIHGCGRIRGASVPNASVIGGRCIHPGSLGRRRPRTWPPLSRGAHHDRTRQGSRPPALP
jgi:hypothetical protein